MSKEQIAILAGLFILTLSGYVYFRKRILNISEWIKINLIFLGIGVLGAVVITPFIYPYELYKNLAVLIIIPIVTYNFYYFINYFTLNFKIGIFVREVIALFSILTGIVLGAEVINISGLAVFRISDIKETLLIAFVFNTGRMLFSYSFLLKVMLKKQDEIKFVKQKESQTQEKLSLIYSKINPHFLYNSLNSIAGLAMIDGKKTKDMTTALSNLLRYSLNYSESNYATIEEEAESIQAYFDVEKIRFEDRLNFEINIPEEIKEFRIPRFLLQPLAENCIKHSFENTESNHLIKIDVTKINDELVIAVHDNGKPFPDKLIPGFGLKNVNDKLDLLFHDKFEIQISNSPVKQIKIIIKDLQRENAF